MKLNRRDFLKGIGATLLTGWAVKRGIVRPERTIFDMAQNTWRGRIEGGYVVPRELQGRLLKLKVGESISGPWIELPPPMGTVNCRCMLDRFYSPDLEIQVKISNSFSAALGNATKAIEELNMTAVEIADISDIPEQDRWPNV